MNSGNCPDCNLYVSPSIQAVRNFLGQLEDWEAEGHVVEELMTLIDDIPCCESATAMPHDEHKRATVPDAATEVQRVSESDLAEVIEVAGDDWLTKFDNHIADGRVNLDPGPQPAYIARAVVGAIGGESRG